MDETLYCVWLQCAFGPGSPVPERVFQNYSQIRDFYDGGIQEWRLSGLFTQEQLVKLERTSLQTAVRVLEDCWRNGYRVIVRSDPAYPTRLAQIPSPPIALYVAGVWPNFERELSIGIVGTRNATPIGIHNTAQIAHGLSKAGAIIVSGGAIGIDTAAHKSTLLAGGKTVSVLGCGLDYNYLPENRSMRNQIQQNGALVSEYPPGTPPLARHFPTRNRIISGLSMGVLMVEGGAKSGAMITMRQALEQNRDVFVVVGEEKEFRSDGVRKLISEGARVVHSAEEVLVDYVYWLRQQEEWLRAEQAQREKESAEAGAGEITEVLEKSVEWVEQRQDSMFHESEISPQHTVTEQLEPVFSREMKEVWRPEDLPEEPPQLPIIPSETWNEKKTTKPVEKRSGTREQPPRKTEPARIPEPVVQQETEIPEFLSDEAKRFASVLSGTPQHIDELTQKAGLTTRDALAAITELEMEGLISGLPGKLYVRK